MCTVVYVLPLFSLPGGGASASRALIGLGLAGAIMLQTAALWEYSLTVDRKAAEFLAAGAYLEDGDKAASLVLEPEPARFASVPGTQLNGLNGIGKRAVVWDNYELAYNLFPLKARDPVTKEFIRDYNVLAAELGTPAAMHGGGSGALAERLDRTIRLNHDKITKLVLWGANPQVEAILAEWFDLSDPVFASGNVRVVRHK